MDPASEAYLLGSHTPFRQAIASFEFPTGPFSQDILIILSLKEEGGVLKIASVVEYVDSFKVKEVKAKMASGAQSS